MAANIEAVLTASVESFKASMAEADASVKGLSESSSSNFSKLSSIGKGALMGIAGVVGVVGVAAVDFGDKLEASQAGLQASLKAAGISWKSVSDSVSQTGNAATKYGFTQAQVDSALSMGVISTQSYSKAHQNLSVAVELAAAKHVDLNTAMQAVDKATQGNTRALMQMGISLPIVSSSALKLKQAQDAVKASQLEALTVLQQYPDALNSASTHHAAYEAAVDKVTAAQGKLKDQQDASGQILDALSKRLGGQAAAAADTFAGRLATAKAQGENLAANIGLRLIPILEKIMTVISGVVTWFEKHKGVAEALGIALAVLVAGPIAAYIAGMVSAAAATVAAAAPWLALIAVAAAIGAAVYEIVKHWSAISKFFVKLWDDVKRIFDDAFGFIKSHLKDFVEGALIVLTGGMALIPMLIVRYWSQIEAFTTRMIGDVVGFFTALPGRIVSALGAIVSTIWGAFSGAAQWIIDHVITPVVNLFIALPGQLVSAIGNIVAYVFNIWLTANAWILNNVIVPVVNWFIQLPGRIASALAGIVSIAFNALLSAGSWIENNVIAPIISFFTQMPGTIATALSGFIGAIFADIGDVASWVDTHIVQPIVNAVKAIPSKIGSIGGQILGDVTGGLGKLGGLIGLATGGVVTSPTVALIGEAGPEAVIPLNDTQRALQILGLPSGTVQPSMTGISSVPPGGGSSGGSVAPAAPQAIYLQVDGQTLARIILPALQTQAALYQRTVPLPVFGVSNVA